MLLSTAAALEPDALALALSLPHTSPCPCSVHPGIASSLPPPQRGVGGGGATEKSMLTSVGLSKEVLSALLPFKAVATVKSLEITGAHYLPSLQASPSSLISSAEITTCTNLFPNQCRWDPLALSHMKRECHLKTLGPENDMEQKRHRVLPGTCPASQPLMVVEGAIAYGDRGGSHVAQGSEGSAIEGGASAPQS